MIKEKKRKKEPLGSNVKNEGTVFAFLNKINNKPQAKIQTNMRGMKTAELQKNLDIQMQNAENLQTKLKKLNDALNRNKKDPAMVLQLQKKINHTKQQIASTTGNQNEMNIRIQLQEERKKMAKNAF